MGRGRVARNALRRTIESLSILLHKYDPDVHNSLLLSSTGRPLSEVLPISANYWVCFNSSRSSLGAKEIALELIVCARVLERAESLKRSLIDRVRMVDRFAFLQQMWNL